MRPYLAILKDAFREAFVSRVLWIVLILLALVLVLIFPLSYRFSLTTEISNSDIVNVKELVSKLAKEINKTDSDTPSENEPFRELVSLMDPEHKAELSQAFEGFRNPSPGKAEGSKGFKQKREESQKQLQAVTQALNHLILEQALSSLASIDALPLSPEGESLLESPNLEKAESQRLNRLIIEQVLGESLRKGPPTSIIFSYLSMEIPGKFPIEKERLFYNVRAIIKYILNFVFNTAGILMALIVTSNIIPQTFDPGSLNLLLSKPISRWKLFIAQFLGGCAFITLTMSFFFVGVWLYLGSRLGYWNPRLLLYIPSFIGIFAVYYSASAVAGLLWRSSIVSVVAGASLWLLTFAMFIVNTFCETSFNSVAFRKLDVYKGNTVVTYVPDHDRKISLWNPKENGWKDLSQGLSSPFGMGLGPLFDPHANRLIGGQQPMISRPFGPPTGGKMEILARDPASPDTQFETLELGLASVKHLFRRQDGRVLLFASGRLHLLAVSDPFNQDKHRPPRPSTTEPPPPAAPLTAQSLGPQKSIRSGGNTAIAFNPETDELAVMRRGKLSIYTPNAKSFYELSNEAEFPQFSEGKTVLGFNGRCVIVFHPKQQAVVIQPTSMQISKTFPDTISFLPRSVHPSPDGKWISVLKENETAWIFSTDSHRLIPLNQGKAVKAIAFDENSKLHLGNRWLQVLQIDPASGTLESKIQGKLTTFQSVYQRVIYPLYFIFPKCGELNYTVEYLITGNDTADTLPTTFLKFLNLDRMMPVPLETYNLQPWPQVGNACIFILVMLGIGCFIIERSDY
ncbi:MAG: ABC transporter permease [Planctomycetota bacterium]|nr:ABC transporter permease [Planctomycetota bacterium]